MTNTLEALTPTVADPEMARELALEEEALHAGVASYRERTTKLEGRGMGATTDYGKKLVSRCVEPLVSGIKKFIADANAKPGKRAAAVKYLELLEPDVASFIAVRTVFDGLTRIMWYQDVAVDIGSAIEDECRFRSFESQNKGLFAKVNDTFDKTPWSYNPNRRKSVLKHAANKFNITWAKWTPSDKFHLGSALIDLFIEHVGLVELHKVIKGYKMTYHLKATEELSQWILNHKEVNELYCPKYMPMVVPPKPWTSPTDGGYFDKRLANRLKLVKTPNRTYHQELAHREMADVYAAVNRLQATPWRINERMLQIIEDLWEAGLDVKGFPSRLDAPLPAKPADFDTNKNAKSSWKRQAASVYRHNVRAGSKRMQTAKIMYLAKRFATEAAIYFPVQLDFRGRMYAIPQCLNPQGCDLAKGLLTFAAGKPLGEDGAFWLAVHVANNFGYDKCSLEERASWAIKNSDRISRCATDPLADRWWMDADKPFQFLAACLEWWGFREQKEAYVCSLPIMVDGSCNGLQHFSAMLRDEVCGAKVNLVPSEKPADIYQTVADAVVVLLDAEARPEFKTFAEQWVNYGINRKLCKRPVMVLPYGGTREAVRKYVLDHVVERATEKNEPHPFGENLMKAVQYIATVIWETMKRVVKGPRLAMDWLQKSARLVAKQNLAINWTTPTGFWVQQAYPDTSRRRVKTKIGHQTVYMTLREELKGKLDARKQAQAVSPNFVHSLDASALVATIVKASDRGVDQFAAIHDSYGTLAADMQTLMDSLRESFVEMYEAHDVLSEFASSVEGSIEQGKKLPETPNRGSLDIQGVLSSDFFFA